VTRTKERRQQQAAFLKKLEEKRHRITAPMQALIDAASAHRDPVLICYSAWRWELYTGSTSEHYDEGGNYETLAECKAAALASIRERDEQDEEDRYGEVPVLTPPPRPRITGSDEVTRLRAEVAELKAKLRKARR
jgi:hypothetical protein